MKQLDVIKTFLGIRCLILIGMLSFFSSIRPCFIGSFKNVRFFLLASMEIINDDQSVSPRKVHLLLVLRFINKAELWHYARKNPSGQLCHG